VERCSRRSPVARQRENADGFDGAATTSTALYCIDGFAGSAVARSRHASRSPAGFAQLSTTTHGPALGSTNYHAETNVLASITEFVKPRPGWPPVGSSGFVIIMSDRQLCNLCAGYIKRWTDRYPGIPVYTVDPQADHAFVAGARIR
jgi:hypothetical protein